MSGCYRQIAYSIIIRWWVVPVAENNRKSWWIFPTVMNRDATELIIQALLTKCWHFLSPFGCKKAMLFAARLMLFWGWPMIHVDGILPEGPYPPCLRMADRDLLAGYPRCKVSSYLVLGGSEISGRPPGGRLNKKDGLTRYGDSHVKDKTS